MTASVELRLDGQVDQLRLAWQVGETLLVDVPFDTEAEATRYHILVAMQELLTNVYRHGYRDEVGAVEIRFEADEHEFTFELRDRAPRFDPLGVPEVPDPGEDGCPGEEIEVKEGGYGIAIVRTVMDDCSYRYENGWNIVRAAKAVKSGVAVGASGETS